MKRLITFGDSWSAGHGVETDVQYKEVISPNDFIDKLRTSNGWPKHLSNHYDIPFVNFGWCNKSNPEIIQDVKDNKQFFDKDDLIVVMLSYPFRGIGEPLHDVASLTNELNGFNYYIFNSFYPTFGDVPSTDNLELSRFLQPNDTFVPMLQQYERDNDISVWEYDFRYPQTWQNTPYGDTHPNYLGYKLIANKIKELIDDYNTSSSTE